MNKKYLAAVERQDQQIATLKAQLKEEVSRRYQAECNYDHAVKDRDTLQRALGMACAELNLSDVEKVFAPDYFIQQAQEQEEAK